MLLRTGETALFGDDSLSDHHDQKKRKKESYGDQDEWKAKQLHKSERQVPKSSHKDQKKHGRLFLLRLERSFSKIFFCVPFTFLRF